MSDLPTCPIGMIAGYSSIKCNYNCRLYASPGCMIADLIKEATRALVLINNPITVVPEESDE